MKKTLVTLLAAGLVAGAFLAVPAEAKKKKKKKKPAACAAYVPGERGASAETFVVTDAHTEEAPLEIPVTLEMSAADFVFVEDPSSFPFNVQVDSAAPEAGLYALFEFPARRDYDLWAYWPTGEEGASSHGFNPAVEANVTVPGTTFNPSNTHTNHAGESTPSSEKLLGVKTADCQGWDMQVDNWFGEGGEMVVKVWLGEIANDAKAPGEAEG